jgi:hypothetical protein
MGYIETFYSDLKGSILSVWPLTKAIWEDVQIQRFPFERMAKEDMLPFVTIKGMFQPAGMGVRNCVDTGEVTLFYIVEDAGVLTVPGTIRPALEEMRAALWPMNFPGGGRVVSQPVLSWDEGVPTNQYFIGKDMPFWSGSVHFQVLVGETMAS